MRVCGHAHARAHRQERRHSYSSSIAHDPVPGDDDRRGRALASQPATPDVHVRASARQRGHGENSDRRVGSSQDAALAVIAESRLAGRHRALARRIRTPAAFEVPRAAGHSSNHLLEARVMRNRNPWLPAMQQYAARARPAVTATAQPALVSRAVAEAHPQLPMRDIHGFAFRTQSP